ncbi:MAG TPA: serine hydrolase domain-containing protein [Candidatus Binatia bacterium]|nr:serine hydrolase domain-containing protein [Candidatus Binatia bacterium]
MPRDLDAVTSIADEVPPRDVDVYPAAVARIWEAVESLYRSGIHPAIQLCVRRRGRVLIDRAIGHADGNGPGDPPETPKTLVSPATPFNIFSASKAVTAMIVHLLDQRDVLRLDDRVCEYLPEFAVRTKQWITIRHVLIHRAGIANVPPGLMDLDRLADPAGIVQLIADLRLTGRPGRQLAYHAITGGFILGEIVRRVTGKTIRAVLDEAIARPLGFRWLGYGVRPTEVDRVARSYFTGPPPLPPLSYLLRRALGVEFRAATAMSNDPRFLTAIVPSANVVATANELSRFYQLLLDGGTLDGVRVFEPRTIRRATSEQSYLELDFTLGLPFRYGMGFMLGADWLSPYGPGTRYAFGHIGFTNIVAWADPERQVAVALTTSGKPLVYPELYWAWEIARRIGLACGKEPAADVERVAAADVRRTSLS